VVHAAHHRFTFDEYLRMEQDSGTKHEFVAGQVYAMSGGTPEHAGVTANVARLLGNALSGKPCRVYSPDLRIRVSVQEVMFVAHDRREIEVVQREVDGTWSRRITRDGETVVLASIDCEVSVSEIYRDPLGGERILPPDPLAQR
jgi:hypothetical protein